MRICNSETWANEYTPFLLPSNTDAKQRNIFTDPCTQTRHKYRHFVKCNTIRSKRWCHKHENTAGNVALRIV